MSDLYNVRTFFLLLFFMMFSCLIKGEKQQREMRAAWLTTNYALDFPKTKVVNERTRKAQKRELITLLDELQAANFNVVFFQVRHRGTVLYKSTIETWTPYLTGKRGRSPGYDPLQFAIEECHKRKMECHAWMVTMPIANRRDVRLIKRGSKLLATPNVCTYFRGIYYLNPAHSKARTYLVNLVDELVKNYSIDGVHLDYIRYPDKSKYYPDSRDYRRAKTKLGKADWRRDNLTKVVAAIYHTVKNRKPWVKVSSATLGRYSNLEAAPAAGWNAFETVYQDVERWVNEGIQDFVVPMMYYDGDLFYPYLHQWQELAKKVPIIPGLGVYMLEADQQDWGVTTFLHQIDYARLIKTGGVAFYRTASLLKNTKGTWSLLTNHYFQTPALLPLMNRTDSIAPLAPIIDQISYRETDFGKVLDLYWKDDEVSQEKYDLSYNVYALIQDSISMKKRCELIIAAQSTKKLSLLLRELPKQTVGLSISACDKFYNESTFSKEIVFPVEEPVLEID